MLCQHKDTRVIDSRNIRKGFGLIRRRRECTACGYRYSTVEIEERELQRLERLAGGTEKIARFIGQMLAEGK